MLAVGRALMSRARLLLLDEPSMGLAPLLVREIFRVIQRINQQGAAILLVEQNAHLALEVAHRAYILETGEIALSGRPSELRHHPQVLEAYLRAATFYAQRGQFLNEVRFVPVFVVHRQAHLGEKYPTVYFPSIFSKLQGIMGWLAWGRSRYGDPGGEKERRPASFADELVRGKSPASRPIL